ncbi:hypothetical protein [Kineococcus terrestris]|uniref:hypothetical protein n=1 Tax=Kineococcus terrestris TaxID=2044856 RepID=UPI0034DAD46D
MFSEGAGVRLSMPQALLLALHVRDAAGLAPPVSDLLPDLPPLAPPAAPLVGASAELAGARAAGEQWARWWAGAFPGGPQALTSILPPRYPGLKGMPELRGFVELDADEAVAWCARARQVEADVLRRVPTALFETNLLGEVERELGRRLRTFRLDVVVLPVAGAHAWEVAGVPVVSLALRADRSAYLEWLRERLLAIGRLRGGSGVPGSDGGLTGV